MVEELARRRRSTAGGLECNSLVAEAIGEAGPRLVLARPQTFMNRSGYAARCLVERRGLELDEVLVVYDDVALPLGRVRLKPSGGPGGHRGVESVLGELRSDEIPRLRLGIAPGEPPEDLVEFVLAPFASDEEAEVEEMVARAADACEAWAAEGAEVAMNRFNVSLTS